MVVVNWDTSSPSSLVCVEGGGADWGTTVERVEGVEWVGATARIWSANFAKLAVSRESLDEAKISLVVVGRRWRTVAS